MKRIKIIVIAVFMIALFIPLITFNFKENVISEIDNRTLTNNPFGDNVEKGANFDLTKELENYISDRIGLRDEMISAYTLINDTVFGEMVHPSYTYGKDGYVFFSDFRKIEYGDFHYAFAQMVKEIQDYCEAREVPFVFVFDPAKTSVLTDKLPSGVNYDSDWVEAFINELDRLGVNYVNNTELMIEKTNSGEVVFNRQYNAGHWNDLGAFYGVNNVLENLKTYFPNIHINTKEEFDIIRQLNTSLQVSKFPINEYEPIFTARTDTIADLTGQWNNEVSLNYQYRHFRNTINTAEYADGSPKTLVFQGSYMNGMGYKFFENSLSEYIAVHDYQNILNFDYYFNLFEPECVIFEVAEYTFLNTYFDYWTMAVFDLANPLSDELKSDNVIKLEKEQISLEEKSNFTTISISGLSEEFEFAYITINGNTYDTRITSGTCSFSLQNVNIDKISFSLTATNKDGTLVKSFSYK